jgi:hypothetical protein
MASKRKAIPDAVRQAVLHEAGYKCSNPSCHILVTIDLHHLEYVSEDGNNEPDNLLPLCPVCHRRHHAKEIPTESLRAWKMLLLALNEAFDRRAVEHLLMLGQVGELRVPSDALLTVSALIASGLVVFRYDPPANPRLQGQTHVLSLSTRGRTFVDGWKNGDQRAALALPAQSTSGK